MGAPVAYLPSHRAAHEGDGQTTLSSANIRQLGAVAYRIEATEVSLYGSGLDGPSNGTNTVSKSSVFFLSTAKCRLHES